MKKIFAFALAALTLFATSCVKDEIYKGPSKIEKVTLTPEAPTSTDAVNVAITVSGLQSVTKATIAYNGATVPMSGSGAEWAGQIPALPDGTNVKVVITVENEAGFKTTAEKEYTVGDPAPDFTKLVLNELYGSAADDAQKAIELFNMGDFPIKLKDVTIKKDEDLAWTGIEGEIIPAHGVFAIVGAKGTTPRGFSSGFSSKKSVLIELFDPSGNKLDTFQRGEKGAGWGEQKLSDNSGSWSRVPDGTGKFMITSKITINAINSDSGTDDPTVVQ